jgi:tRNA A-37 threonylcarbamoyl transferase component Bud32/tetratricopeptide (TPR) repeat protein
MDILPGSRIGRIRIDALTGSGGMGAVYRGWDERLERAVAIKVVHTGAGVSAFARARFLREARVLSKLDAPNICRIYDVIEREDGDCLVLELVEGDTLRAALPKLDRSEALRIALTIARVLALAHERGIVHRDLKPENVMLTPSGDVKVLDFGLARTIGDEGDGSAPDVDIEEAAENEQTATIRAGHAHAIHTSAGSVVGTLHYMSPEQTQGRPLSDASDIYSLGIVLVEMLQRGQDAYGGAIGIGLVERVRRAQLDPYDFHDRALNTLLRRMTAQEAGNRPRAANVVRALEAIVARPQRIKQRLRVAGIALAFAIVAAALAVFGERFLGNRVLAGARHGGRIAILPFRNTSNDPSLKWVELGMMDFVAQTLSSTNGSLVVASEDVIRAMKNLGIERGKALDEAQRRRLLDALDADVLVDATVESHAGAFTIHYAPLTNVYAESPHEITGAALPDAVNELARQLARRLNPGTHPVDVRESYSADGFANLAYAMGVQEMETGGPALASHYFAVCLNRDPDFLWARVMLADCRHRSGAVQEGSDLLGRVIEQSRRKHDDALLAEALYRDSKWGSESGDLVSSDRYATEAMALEQRRGNVKGVARNINTLGRNALTRHDLDRAQAYFIDALAKYRAIGSRRYQAVSLHNLGLVADYRLDRVTARKRYEAALQTAVAVGDRSLEASALANLGRLASYEGDMQRAEAYARRNLAIVQETGDHAQESLALINLSALLYNAGRDADSQPLMERALALSREMKDRRIQVFSLSNLGITFVKRGNLAAAETPLAEARQIATTMQDPVTRNYETLSETYLDLRAGRLADAERLLAEAERLGITSTTLLGRARIAYERGNFPLAATFLDQAKARHEGWGGYEQSLEQAVAASDAAKTKVALTWERPLRKSEG